MNLVCASLNHSPYGDQQGDESKLVVAACLNSGGNQGGFRTEPGEHLVTHSLRGEGFDVSEDGTGRGTPITPVMNGVRRLTPTECERLQAFPDGWTCLCQPLEQYDVDRCTCADGPRYKALGNAVTVNVIEWIGKRIMEVERCH